MRISKKYYVFNINFAKAKTCRTTKERKEKRIEYTKRNDWVKEIEESNRNNNNNLQFYERLQRRKVRVIQTRGMRSKFLLRSKLSSS